MNRGSLLRGRCISIRLPMNYCDSCSMQKNILLITGKSNLTLHFPYEITNYRSITMAQSKTHVHIFSPSEKMSEECRHAVTALSREALIALDSEGVNLGKNGPLTLLQIGTLSGTVYLFDVMLNEKIQDKDFFKDTGLDKLLTSKETIKVKNDLSMREMCIAICVVDLAHFCSLPTMFFSPLQMHFWLSKVFVLPLSNHSVC